MASPLLLELTDQQLVIIRSQIDSAELTLLNWKFNDPAMDQQLIRQHAFLCGERAALLSLLSFDDKVRAAADQEISANLE